jgi:molybdopterin/thiamine biosynthesis adenylyltransferase
VGQLTTQFPGDTVIEEIYRQNYENGRILSTPAFTPALVASLQVAETVKILLGRGELLRNRIMLINLLDMDMETIELCTDD